ncbi:hypothetical protein Tco_1401275 [Tanacetum coccineum]
MKELSRATDKNLRTKGASKDQSSSTLRELQSYSSIRKNGFIPDRCIDYRELNKLTGKEPVTTLPMIGRPIRHRICKGRSIYSKIESEVVGITNKSLKQPRQNLRKTGEHQEWRMLEVSLVENSKDPEKSSEIRKVGNPANQYPPLRMEL